MASIHVKNLADLCRVCGERLQKSNKAVTLEFLCIKWKDFLAEKFEIVVEEDLEEIHQQYFCHSCYAHPDRRTLVTATWLTHYDDNCRVCSHVEEIKKGERPKKPKRGRKADSRPSFRRQRTPTKPLYKILKSLLKTYLLFASRSFPINFPFPKI